MSKLQRIKRVDGTESFSSNIPIAIIKEMEWQKGDNLSLEIKELPDRKVVVMVNKDVENGRN